MLLRVRPTFVLLIGMILSLVLTASWPFAQDKVTKDAPGADYSAELPRIPPKSPEEAMKTFSVLPGFEIRQAAAEPLVHSPVAIDFDENGRLFVIEMIDYSEQDKEFLGALRVLEDTDGDGRFDKSEVYADKLSWPTALLCWDGGVFIGAAPDIYYVKDTNGDGKADVRKTVFTGFNRNNVQGLINSFHWGLDNRIHGATGTVGGSIKRPDAPDVPAVNVNGRDFSFDPKTLELRPESGGAQHGMSFDDFGRKFACSNSDHIQMVMFEDRYVARNPFAAAPSPRVSIAADGPQAEVYRTSPVEPWRIVRTRLRVNKVVPGVVEGGGRAAGYFTGATGTTLFRGDAFPPEYRGQAFVGDVGSNIVHRKVLEPNGVGFIAKRVDDKKEFLTSTDIWFRPAQFANAPDGTLYVCDVYREVIEHPASLPPEIKKHLDLTSGRDRGRLYHLVPQGYQQRPPVKIGSAPTAELVALLEHRNGWHRDAASRLLYTRQDASAVPLLEKLAQSAKIPEGRIHALYALSGLKALTGPVIHERLKDENPRVREHAVRLAEEVLADSADVRETLVSMTGDADLRVVYQLAFTLGEVKTPARNAALTQILKTKRDDKWIRLAVMSSLFDGAGDVLAALLTDEKFRTTGKDLFSQLSLQVGTQARQAEVAAVLKTLNTLPENDAAAGLVVRGLTEGLTRANSPLRSLVLAGRSGKLLEELLETARKTVADEAKPVGARVDAIRTLALGSFANDAERLQELLNNRQPQEVQLAALSTLGRFSDSGVGPALLASWRGFSPKVRSVATETIFSRPEWLSAYLDAVQKEDIPLSDVEPARVRLLLMHPDKEIQEKAKVLAGKLQIGKRQDVLVAYKDALTTKGDAAKGKVVFQKICSACHKLEGVGHEIGPTLATVRNRGAEFILTNVLDPNREVNPQYLNYSIATTEGKTLTGMIAAETATSVTLKRAENQTDTVLRTFIEEFQSSGVSLMPEGLEKQIDVQSMADVIEYLMSLK